MKNRTSEITNIEIVFKINCFEITINFFLNENKQMNIKFKQKPMNVAKDAPNTPYVGIRIKLRRILKTKPVNKLNSKMKVFLIIKN